MKVIQIKPVDKKYFICSVCFNDENVKDIITGADENKTFTLRLCENCRKELKEKL